MHKYGTAILIYIKIIDNIPASAVRNTKIETITFIVYLHI